MPPDNSPLLTAALLSVLTMANPLADQLLEVKLSLHFRLIQDIADQRCRELTASQSHAVLVEDQTLAGLVLARQEGCTVDVLALRLTLLCALSRE